MNVISNRSLKKIFSLIKNKLDYKLTVGSDSFYMRIEGDTIGGYVIFHDDRINSHTNIFAQPIYTSSSGGLYNVFTQMSDDNYCCFYIRLINGDLPPDGFHVSLDVLILN